MDQRRPDLSTTATGTGRDRGPADRPAGSQTGGGSTAGPAPPDDSQGTPRPPTADDRPVLPKDVIFDLLRVERRRLTLRYLRQEGPDASLSTLATWIAARENDISIEAVASDQRKRVYIALYQSHLPKMDDADVVDFDAREGAIVLAGNASVLYPYLDLGPSVAGPSSPASRLSAIVRRLRGRIGLGSRPELRGG